MRISIDQLRTWAEENYAEGDWPQPLYIDFPHEKGDIKSKVEITSDGNMVVLDFTADGYLSGIEVI